MPRQESAVWRYFAVTKTNGSAPKAVCKCDNIFVKAQAQRLINHLVMSCPAADLSVKRQWAQHVKTPTSSGGSASLFTNGSSNSNETTASAGVATVASSKSLSDQRDFQIDFALVLYALSWSFVVVDNRHLQAFVAKYLPGYKLPTRQTLGGDLLKVVYKSQRDEVVELLQSEPFISVVTDGRADAKGEYVMNYILVTSGLRPLFCSSVVVEDEDHDGVMVSAKLLSVIEEVEASVESPKVCGVVTDNASVMARSWRLLRESRKDIICNGCAAHVVNLVIQKVFEIPKFKKVLKVHCQVREKTLETSRSVSSTPV